MLTVGKPLRADGVGEFEVLVLLAERVEAKEPASLDQGHE